MRKRMETNQVSNPIAIDENKYLVTEKSDISEFSETKISSDLAAIKKAELRSKKRASITMDREESEVTRAMDALGLTNPFKGV
jgi:hypothetical protein